MHHATDRRRAASRAGLLSTFTAAAACSSALSLMTGCQPAPKVSAFADTPAQHAAEVRLQQTGTDDTVVPFDEKFYVPPPADGPEAASAP